MSQFDESNENGHWGKMGLGCGGVSGGWTSKSGQSGRNGGGGKEEEVLRGGEEEVGGGGKEEGSGREMEGEDTKGLIGEVLDEILRFFAAGGVDDDEVWMLRRM